MILLFRYFNNYILNSEYEIVGNCLPLYFHLQGVIIENNKIQELILEYPVTKWNTDDFGIRIYKSDTYSGDFKAQNSAVFFSKNEDETVIERLKDNKVDMAFLPEFYYDEAKSLNINIYSAQSSLLLLRISDKFSRSLKESFARLTAGKTYVNSLKGSYTVANSIYVDKDYRRQGIGALMYGELEKRLKDLGIVNMLAGSAFCETEDEYLSHDSYEFHKHMGYEKVAQLKGIGKKFDRWYDLLWMQKKLQPEV